MPPRSMTPEVPTLRVLSSGPIPPNPADLLGSDEMQALLGQLRHAADFVVIDTAPVLAVSDALILAPSSDGVLVVGGPSPTCVSSSIRSRARSSGRS